MKRIIMCLAALCVVLGPPSVRADVVLSLSNITVNAGDTAVVSVNIADTGAVPSALSGYNIPLDITTAAGFTFNGISSFSVVNNLGSFAPEEANAVLNYDFGVSDNGAPLQLGAAPITLFEIEFGVDPGAVAGSVLPVDFEQNPGAPGNPIPTFFSLSLDNAAVNVEDLVASGGATVSDGLITVVGVPEPSNLALAVIGLGGLVLRRRRN